MSRTIKIDFDIYQLIVLEKRDFDEPDTVALRRLLGLPVVTDNGPSEPHAGRGLAWTGKGVTLPHGTKLKMTYRGHDHFGEIIEEKWGVEGNAYSTPSQAAKGVSGGVSLNGWIYWYVKRPTDTDWLPIDDLRREAT